MHKIIKSPWHDSLPFSSLCVHWKTIGNCKTYFMIKSNYYRYYYVHILRNLMHCIRYTVQCMDVYTGVTFSSPLRIPTTMIQ